MKRLIPVILLASGMLLIAASTSPGQQPANHAYDAWFTKTDRNKDGFLDAEELAKGFRGANAKPITDKPGAAETHPDHLFLARWDADKDGRISKAEYEKYEQSTLAQLRTSANRRVNYSRFARSGYRSPLRHRGFSARGAAGRGFGTNPYLSMMRYQQRAYQMQRSAYSNLRRYGVYTPSVRGGYRGVQRHHHVRRFR